MSFKARLSEAATAEELRVVMWDLVRQGSPNWTYHSAAHFVAPDLWEELGEYFDDVTGKPRWPQRDPRGAGDLMHAAKGPASSVSDAIRRFHDRLAAVVEVPRSAEQGSAPRASATATSASAKVLPSDEVPSKGSLDDEELASAHCAICERTVFSQLVEFRGMPMCQDCADLLRR